MFSGNYEIFGFFLNKEFCFFKVIIRSKKVVMLVKFFKGIFVDRRFEFGLFVGSWIVSRDFGRVCC